MSTSTVYQSDFANTGLANLGNTTGYSVSGGLLQNDGGGALLSAPLIDASFGVITGVHQWDLRGISYLTAVGISSLAASLGTLLQYDGAGLWTWSNPDGSQRAQCQTPFGDGSNVVVTITLGTSACDVEFTSGGVTWRFDDSYPPAIYGQMTTTTCRSVLTLQGASKCASWSAIRSYSGTGATLEALNDDFSTARNPWDLSVAAVSNAGMWAGRGANNGCTAVSSGGRLSITNTAASAGTSVDLAGTFTPSPANVSGDYVSIQATLVSSTSGKATMGVHGFAAYSFTFTVGSTAAWFWSFDTLTAITLSSAPQYGDLMELRIYNVNGTGGGARLYRNGTRIDQGTYGTGDASWTKVSSPQLHAGPTNVGVSGSNTVVWDDLLIRAVGASVTALNPSRPTSCYPANVLDGPTGGTL